MIANDAVRRLIAACCLPVAIVALGVAPAARVPDATVATVRRDLAINPIGHYLSPQGACHAVTRAGWAGFPTQECTYTGSAGEKLQVILLNPSTAQLARWLVTACTDAHATNVVPCAERLALVTSCQSGAQFPVAGYVDEGDVFTFRDGVTARMGDLPSTVVPPANVDADANVVFNGAPSEAKSYARISSTTREEFAAFVGQPVSQFAGLAWIATVRAEYQRAWGNDRNRLMSARVAADPAAYDVPTWGNGFDDFCMHVAGCPPKKGDPDRCGRIWHPWPAAHTTADSLKVPNSPAHRKAVAQIIGELAMSSNPDGSAAAKQIDAVLSPAEKSAVIAANQAGRAQMAKRGAGTDVVKRLATDAHIPLTVVGVCRALLDGRATYGLVGYFAAETEPQTGNRIVDSHFVTKACTSHSESESRRLPRRATLPQRRYFLRSDGFCVAVKKSAFASTPRAWAMS